MIRRSFRRFRYIECDDFAAYLSRKAKEGWHFRGWKLGMLFEKGEPEEAEYAVDVFIKGAESDVKPGKDAEEFAEYCEAAGWEFVDANRKFCVFKKRAEDAEAIVTIEEKVENAAGAEMKMIGLNWVLYLFLAFLYGSDFFEAGSDYMFFYNSMLYLPVLFILIAVRQLVDLGQAFVWNRKAKKRLALGQEIYVGIGERKQWRRYLIENAVSILLVGTLFVTLLMDQKMSDVLQIAIWVFVLFGCYGLLMYVRPTREEHIATSVAIAFLIPITAALFFFAAPEDTDGVYKDKNAAPLIQEDYREVEAPFEKIYIQQKSNLLGSIIEYDVNYDVTTEESGGDMWDEIIYKVIDSEYQWLLDHIYRTMTKEAKLCDNMKEAWGAQEVYYFSEWSNFYYVRYENQIFEFRDDSPVTEEQIMIIREKVGLGQVN